MRNLALLSAAAVVMGTGLAGCSKKPASPASEHDHGDVGHDHGGAATGRATAPPDPGTPSTLGGLDEASFKAMHGLRGDHAPPRKGTTIELAGGKAYLSLPAGSPPFPGLVVIHEWWGKNEHIEHWADRLAGAGYAALAVDLYRGKVATTPDDAMAAMKAVDKTEAARTIAAALDLLAKDPRVAAPRTGSIGWCFGGGWSLQAALAHPDLDAAVIYYGQPETDPAKLRAIKARVLGVFANQDKGIPPAKVDELEAGLRQAGVDARILRYDADHAFANPSGARYDQAAASAAWAEVEKFLAANLAP